MKIKLFEDFTNEKKQIASSGTVTMYNLKPDDIEMLKILRLSVEKDEENSTDQDTTYEVKFKTKADGQELLNWIEDKESAVPREDLEHLYPALFEDEINPITIHVGEKNPVTLSVVFGKDQISMVEKNIDKLKAEKHIITYKKEDKGAKADIVKYVIEFASVYGVYLFGHAQGSYGRDKINY